MNYYIDFDNTVYETANLTKKMIRTICNSIVEMKKIDYEVVRQDVEDGFKSSEDNILDYAKKKAIKYEVNHEVVVDDVKRVIANGEEFVFEDAVKYIKHIKENSGNRVICLTYIPKTNQEYQLMKILGSKIAGLYDEIFITTEPKFTLDLKYDEGIFIDDNAKDLIGLHGAGAKNLIRIRRANNKHSKVDIDSEYCIPEYKSFDELYK